jgi:signal transduction histidine kinase
VRDELVNMLMHDVGNMVSGIRSALSLFQVLPPDSADALRYVDEAYESTEVLGGIISDALNMTKLESQNIRLRRKETNLETLVEGLLRASRGLADERQISLGLLVDDPAAATGYVDPTLMRRIAANLLLNAIRYAPESTSVTVRLSRGDGSGGVRLSVIDEGPGLSEEQQARMFDKIGVARHFAEHHEHLGYGLGLAFCKMAVQAHHGILAVQSAPGKGSTFTVEIPGLSDAERAAQDD